MKERTMKKPNRQSGQSLVEMALGLIVIVILFSGLVDLGRVYFVYVAMEDSVGEAALYLSINSVCWKPADGPTCTDPNNGFYRAEHAVTGVLDKTRATYTVNPPAATQRDEVGDAVTVRMKYTVDMITPIISQIVGPGGLTLTVDATQTIITEYIP